MSPGFYRWLGGYDDDCSLDRVFVVDDTTDTAARATDQCAALQWRER